MTQTSIGRYEIEAEIGRGGMAVVYVAYDPRFRRKVAIKLVSVKLQENQIYRERFEREAQLIAKIEHPAIVPVYDFGEQDDEPYLVMRYMPGGALSSKIKQGPLAVSYTSQIISQLAPALDAVHAQGIVHRDLKPANILLDGFGNPAISDFGIAHFTQATSDLTGNAIIGTPAYMSPEQIRGDVDLDGRSDTYALGVILFEMLRGSGPFRAATPMSVAMKHLNDAVPSMHSFRPDLPAGIDDILKKALAKKREMRYETASEFARELQDVAASRRPQRSTAAVRPAPTEDAATELDLENGQPSLASSVVQSTASPSAKLRTAANGRARSDVKAPTSSSRNLMRMVVIAALGIFVFFLCGSIGAFGTWAGLSGVFQGQDPTPTPALAVIPTENLQETILFADDFSDPNSGWPTGRDSLSEYGYQSNAYYIFANGNNSKPWVSTDRVYGDISVYVDARSVSADPNGSYGLLCRIQDAQDFYYFMITDGGAYAIGKFQNGEFQPFFPEGWRQSNAILRNSQINHMRADCTGSTLRFYVNDVLLAEMTDSDFTSGMIGMTAGSLNDQGYEAMFDNFRITQLGQ